MDTLLILIDAIYFRIIAFTDKIAFMDKIAFTDKNCLYRQKLPLQTKIAFTDKNCLYGHIAGPAYFL